MDRKPLLEGAQQRQPHAVLALQVYMSQSWLLLRDDVYL